MYIDGYFIEPQNISTYFSGMATAQEKIANQSGIDIFIKDSNTKISSDYKNHQHIFILNSFL